MKTLAPYGFSGEFFQTCKGEIISIVYKFLQKIGELRILSNSFYEASNITLVSRPGKDIIRKEKYRLITLIINTKIINNNLANQI